MCSWSARCYKCNSLSNKRDFWIPALGLLWGRFFDSVCKEKNIFIIHSDKKRIFHAALQKNTVEKLYFYVKQEHIILVLQD
jgi:hypothetical protein